MSHVTVGIAQTLIERDTEPLRFERFCADLVSSIEGDARIVTTSSNYDRGRDAVSVGGAVYVVVMCSLTDALDAKAISDAKKLARGLGFSKRPPDAVYFCSSQAFTEARADKIEADMRGALSLQAGFDRVTALSGVKLAQLAARQPALFEKHYPRDLADIRKVLAEGADADESEHALRLALSTSAADDAAVIREGVWKALLRFHLARGAASANALCASISNYLKLSASISTHVLVSHLNGLIDDGEVENNGGVYSLTEDGQAAFEADEARVAKGLFDGKQSLVAALKSHLNTEITPDQSERMWHAVQEQLASVFHERGREVLSQISLLLNEHNQHEPAEEFDLVAALADAAAGAFDHADQKQEVRTAIRDIVLEGEAEAVRWLARAAYGFVCACAMGLEERTRAALESVIGGTSLIFDTDVVLSYLSPDEPAHDAVKAIRTRWKALGGKVLLADEVAAEVAYHAWIAQTDADHVGPHLLKTVLDRQVLSRNAFVRGFARLLADGKAKRNQWNAWITQFRGRDRNDVSATKETLTRDHGFGVLPPPSGKYRGLAERIRNHLQDEENKQQREKPFDKHDEFVRRDKMKRDATLFASTMQIREQADEGEGSGLTFLLTSSSRFARLERKFRQNEDSFVLTIPAVLYLLSMAPDRGLGLTALRGFIFDERWKERINDFELMALRLVKESDQFDLPWAKRHVLLRRLGDRARRIAIDRSKGRGRDSKVLTTQVEKEWTTADGKQQMLRELASALDDIAADRRAELELARAQAEIAELKRQLAEERARSRSDTQRARPRRKS